ncbi:hypothetical protein LMG28688_02768 [Paraburkholderia caffeinitolerans]|uniref:Uncharacterized protein n=1 Tax=Paraburkholderia caffeinitolerans TaxID=1723730 RepID=A0A6J5FXQ0_9BURK|nr:hypothetical protein LMG28688_02768 [Paraburkholderia caffeinitolerans]
MYFALISLVPLNLTMPFRCRWRRPAKGVIKDDASLAQSSGFQPNVSRVMQPPACALVDFFRPVLQGVLQRKIKRNHSHRITQAGQKIRNAVPEIVMSAD